MIGKSLNRKSKLFSAEKEWGVLIDFFFFFFYKNFPFLTDAISSVWIKNHTPIEQKVFPKYCARGDTTEVRNRKCSIRFNYLPEIFLKDPL